MEDKSLNLCDECAVECVYFRPQQEQWTCSSWRDSKMYTPSIIANLQRTPTKTNKNVTIAKVRILVEQVIL